MAAPGRAPLHPTPGPLAAAFPLDCAGSDQPPHGSLARRLPVQVQEAPRGTASESARGKRAAGLGSESGITGGRPRAGLCAAGPGRGACGVAKSSSSASLSPSGAGSSPGVEMITICCSTTRSPPAAPSSASSSATQALPPSRATSRPSKDILRPARAHIPGRSRGRPSAAPLARSRRCVHPGITAAWRARRHSPASGGQRPRPGEAAGRRGPYSARGGATRQGPERGGDPDHLPRPGHCYCSQLVPAPHAFARQILFAAKAARAECARSDWLHPSRRYATPRAAASPLVATPGLIRKQHLPIGRGGAAGRFRSDWETVLTVAQSQRLRRSEWGGKGAVGQSAGSWGTLSWGRWGERGSNRGLKGEKRGTGAFPVPGLT